MTKPPKRPIPSGEAVVDLATIVERTMLSPGDELRGVLVLAMARSPEGKIICRIVATPVEQEDRLLDAMRGYLGGPPPDLLTFRSE